MWNDPILVGEGHAVCNVWLVEPSQVGPGFLAQGVVRWAYTADVGASSSSETPTLAHAALQGSGLSDFWAYQS